MSLKSFRLVEEFVQERNASAAVALVHHKGRQYGPVAFGHTAFFPDAPAVTKDTIFDIASLTKVVGTTTITLMLLEDGLFDLRTELGDLLGDVPRDKASITMEHLLSHTSGLPAWVPLYINAKEPRDVIEQVLACPLEYTPGSQVVYSCLGFILLTHIIQTLTGLSLDALVKERVIQPLQMDDTRYNPPKDVHPRVAYTEWCPRSKQFLRGTVHDENAQAMNGISGNAGLFSTAEDLSKFARMILDGGRTGGQVLLSQATLALLENCYTKGLNDRRTLGWMLYNQPGSSGGELMSDSAIGHTGFTGTSLWIDKAQDLFVVLLTNRVHPVRTNEAVFRLRREFHTAVVAELSS